MGFERIIKSYRKPIRPSFTNVKDIHQNPNDILLSYFLEDNPNLTKDTLSKLLGTPSELNEELNNNDFFSPSVSIPEDISSALNMDISLSAQIRYLTNKIAIEFGDQILMGDKNPRKHTYPNGEEVDYFLVTNEVSANLPISIMAFCFSTPPHLFVRENSYKMTRALANCDTYNPSRENPPNFDEEILGIVLSHEYIEARLLEDPDFDQLPLLEREIAVERKSKKRLEEKGISPHSYQLFHQLRQTQDHFL